MANAVGQVGYSGNDEGAARRKMSARSPHVVLISAGPEDNPDFSCIVRFRQMLAHTEFLVFAIEPEGDLPFKAFAAGATGCLSRQTSLDTSCSPLRDTCTREARR